MEGWQYSNQNYIFDMHTNLTSSNLDYLLESGGLCVAGTSFCQRGNSVISPFYDVLPDEDCQLKAEADSVFALLAYYGRVKKLWLAPAEAVFDRMLTLEQVQVSRVEYAYNSHLIFFYLTNGSDKAVDDLQVGYKGYSQIIPVLAGGETVSVSFPDFRQQDTPIPHSVYYSLYKNDKIYVLTKQDDALPSLLAEIYNLKGQKVCSARSQSNMPFLAFPFSQHAPGLYIIRIKPDNGKAEVLRCAVVK